MAHVEGADAASMIRGKDVLVEREDNGSWRTVGTLLATSTPTGTSRWYPAGGWLAMTAEGYSGDSPLYFEVPTVEPSEYRLRLDLAIIGDTPVRERTATLCAELRVIEHEEPTP